LQNSLTKTESAAKGGKETPPGTEGSQLANTVQVKPHPAAVLLARREMRRSFLQWCRHVMSFLGQAPAKHHELLISKLQAIEDGTATKHLIINMPPGSAKSTYASVLFPPHYLAKHPNHTVLACSYSYTLIEGFGRRCRNLIDEKQNILNISLAKDSKAAGEWETSKGGRYFCAGVNAGIAGHRADLAMIDDYIGTQQDADSKLYRDTQWLWYLNDFKPRLKPNAFQVIIANRRHEDDLVGRILKNESEKWEVIRLPLIAEDDDVLGRKTGELLWPEWFNQNIIDTAKQDPRTFSGLYQQRPTPESGDYFQRSWIEPYYYKVDELPKDLRYYIGSDHAVSLREAADRTCLIPIGVDVNDVIWVLPDVWWKRANTGEVVEAMIDMVNRRKPISWWAGKEHITSSIGPFLYKRCRERKTYFTIEETTSKRDLRIRAQAIKGRMQMGMIRFPAFATWWADALHELLTFDAGLHDDFIAALSEIGMGLQRITKPSKQVAVATFDPTAPWRPTFKWIKENEREQARETEIRKLDY